VQLVGGTGGAHYDKATDHYLADVHPEESVPKLLHSWIGWKRKKKRKLYNSRDIPKTTR